MMQYSILVFYVYSRLPGTVYAILVVDVYQGTWQTSFVVDACGVDCGRDWSGRGAQAPHHMHQNDNPHLMDTYILHIVTLPTFTVAERVEAFGYFLQFGLSFSG